MDAMRQDLMQAAAAAARSAYAPYSGFRVGAAVRAASGRVYAGTNVENVAYPLGTCAEAAALAAARLAEGEALLVERIAIWAEHGGRHVGCAPCGGCRQRIVELAPSATVVFHAPDLSLVERPARDLLPEAFVF